MCPSIVNRLSHPQKRVARTWTTSAAGEPKDLSSPRDALSKDPRAASASAMMGSAACSSRAHSSWNAITSVAMPASCKAQMFRICFQAWTRICENFTETHRSRSVVRLQLRSKSEAVCPHVQCIADFTRHACLRLRIKADSKREKARMKLPQALLGPRTIPDYCGSVVGM